MNIKPIGSNQNLLTTNHGDEVLFSYETPVAGYSPRIGWFKNTKKYNITTSGHVNKYLQGVDTITRLSPEEIEVLFLGDLK